MKTTYEATRKRDPKWSSEILACNEEDYLRERQKAQIEEHAKRLELALDAMEADGPAKAMWARSREVCRHNEASLGFRAPLPAVEAFDHEVLRQHCTATTVLNGAFPGPSFPSTEDVGDDVTGGLFGRAGNYKTSTSLADASAGILSVGVGCGSKANSVWPSSPYGEFGGQNVVSAYIRHDLPIPNLGFVPNDIRRMDVVIDVEVQEPFQTAVSPWRLESAYGMVGVLGYVSLTLGGLQDQFPIRTSHTNEKIFLDRWIWSKGPGDWGLNPSPVDLHKLSLSETLILDPDATDAYVRVGVHLMAFVKPMGKRVLERHFPFPPVTQVFIEQGLFAGIDLRRPDIATHYVYDTVPSGPVTVKAASIGFCPAPPLVQNAGRLPKQ